MRAIGGFLIIGAIVGIFYTIVSEARKEQIKVNTERAAEALKRYRVDYTSGSFSYSLYTDSYKIVNNGNCVKTDKRTLCGTFNIRGNN